MKRSILFVKEESTYTDPVVTDAVQTLAEGLEFSPTRDLATRAIITKGIGMAPGIPGIRHFAATVPCELRASSVAGGAPEFDSLLKAQSFNNITDSGEVAVTGKGTGTLNIADADAAKVPVGTIVIVPESTGDVVTPITGASSSGGTTTLTTLVNKTWGTITGDKIMLMRMYKPTDQGIYLSLTRMFNKQLRQYAFGCIGSGLQIGNMTPGQLPTATFNFEGISQEQKHSSFVGEPTYNDAVPPIALNVKVYQGNTDLQARGVSEFSLDVSNQVSQKETITGDGKDPVYQVEREITGNLVAFLDDSDVSPFFTRFDVHQPFDLFISSGNVGASAGKLKEIIAFYLPNCSLSGYTTPDTDGLVTENIPFSAGTSETEPREELLIGFY